MAAALVFFMQAGFACVEAGFTRAKNSINIMMKNLMDFAVGSISGAMAERTKFVSYLLYSAVISAFIYPLFGGWAWGSLFHGGGWPGKLGFIDFAGSTVVHSIGGWAALAVLVGITAGCANVSPTSSIIIGAMAGVLVVLSALFFDRIGIDDPVGAVSVHGVCRAWGTMAAGLFNIEGVTAKLIGVQLLGIGTAFVWSSGTCYILLRILKAMLGLRVTPEEEVEGPDIAEHGGSRLLRLPDGVKAGVIPFLNQDGNAKAVDGACPH